MEQQLQATLIVFIVFIVSFSLQYIGSRKKTMADCQLLIFQDEVREWCKSDEVLRTRYAIVLRGCEMREMREMKWGLCVHSQAEHAPCIY